MSFPLRWRQVDLLLDIELLGSRSLFKNKSCMSSLVSINVVFWEVRVMQIGVIGLWPWAVFKESKYLVKRPLVMLSLFPGQLLLANVLGGGQRQLWPET